MPLRRCLHLVLIIAIALVFTTRLSIFSPLAVRARPLLFESSSALAPVEPLSDAKADTDIELQRIDPIICFGPRGKLLDQSPDDRLGSLSLNRGT